VSKVVNAVNRGYGSEGWGFDSLRARWPSSLAPTSWAVVTDVAAGSYPYADPFSYGDDEEL
jgi:hypothetical protein